MLLLPRVQVLRSVSHEGLWKRKSQGQVWTWTVVVNMGILCKMSQPWTSLSGLCCLSIIVNVHRVLSSAKASFLVQGLWQEPKTAMPECPNIFGRHTTSGDPGIHWWFPLEPFVATTTLISEPSWWRSFLLSYTPILPSQAINHNLPYN